MSLSATCESVAQKRTLSSLLGELRRQREYLCVCHSNFY